MPNSVKRGAPKSRVARAAAAKSAQPAVPDPESNEANPKQVRLIRMLQSPTGMTIAAMMKETGWQQHSVRGFLAGVVRKKLKLVLSSKKIDGSRVYSSARRTVLNRRAGKRSAARPD